MNPRLYDLLEKARKVQMTPAQREAQRRSFAYGNTRFENPAITRNIVRQAAEELNRTHE